MNTQTQTFEQLRVLATPGPYRKQGTCVGADENTVCECAASCLTTTKKANADAEAITRLLNTFIHGDGVRVLRDFMRDFESRMGDWENPEFTESYNEMARILKQLDGETKQ